MRIPLKLNRRGWSPTISRLLRGADDPRELLSGNVDGETFSRAVSTLKFGTTFKTTGAGRFPLTIAKLAALPFPSPPVILDVGASDGSTSLDVIRKVPFRRYFSTDLNNECAVERRDRWTYFYGADGMPSVAASDRWIAYRDTRDALPLLGAAARRVFARAPAVSASSARVPLINPALLALGDARVSTLRYGILDPWPGERIDLVIAANILNRTYFDDSTLAGIVRTLAASLNAAPRWIAIIDNRDSERSSLIETGADGARVRERVGAGADVEQLAVEALRRES